jgi:hypothetical protein
MKQFYHQVHAGQAYYEISPGFFRSQFVKQIGKSHYFRLESVWKLIYAICSRIKC